MLWFQSAARRRLLRARRVDVSFARRCPSLLGCWGTCSRPAHGDMPNSDRQQAAHSMPGPPPRSPLLEAQDYVGPKAFRLGSLAAEREAIIRQVLNSTRPWSPKRLRSQAPRPRSFGLLVILSFEATGKARLAKKRQSSQLDTASDATATNRNQPQPSTTTHDAVVNLDATQSANRETGTQQQRVHESTLDLDPMSPEPRIPLLDQ